MSSKEKNPPASYLPLLLIAILLDEVCDNYFLGVFSERSMVQQTIFYISFLTLQIIASPLQAGFSDFYCRKKSLLASLCCSVGSLVFVFFYFKAFFSQLFALSVAVLLKGILGNTLPIAWAGIADTKSQNYRFSLGLSTSTIAVGYLLLIIIDSLFKQHKAVYVISLLFIALIPVVWKKFVDLVDRKSQREQISIAIDKEQEQGSIKYFLRLIYLDFQYIRDKFLKSTRFCAGLFGTFFPLEISFYSTHVLGVDLVIKKFEIVTVSMIIGYISGVLILKRYKDKEDGAMISSGYKISFISFLPIFLAVPFLSAAYLRWIIVPCYFAYSFGAAFIVPSLFSILSKEREPHEQGKIYGLIDSTDTIALLIASIIGMFYAYLLNPIYIVCFSFFTFLISWFYYGNFTKTEKKDA